ncbi:hypothetical protein I4U23_025008 [Adineta vaga]|nr:hypothetical protein I4U23_025008 [Adineta vaga]
MGKRGRKPMKSDSNTRLEKSRESARQCRHRKKLRYEYLEELVDDREKAIAQLHQEVERLRSVCQQIDQFGVTNVLHQELVQWNDDSDVVNFN